MGIIQLPLLAPAFRFLEQLPAPVAKPLEDLNRHVGLRIRHLMDLTLLFERLGLAKQVLPLKPAGRSARFCELHFCRRNPCPKLPVEVHPQFAAFLPNRTDLLMGPCQMAQQDHQPKFRLALKTLAQAQHGFQPVSEGHE